VSKGLNPQSTSFLVMLGVAGLICTVLGLALREHSFPATFCTSLGGTAFGSALGMWFGRVFEAPHKEQTDEVVKALAEANRNSSQMEDLLSTLKEASRYSILATHEGRYDHFRKRLHGYLRSRDEQGGAVWRYRVFDFSVSRTPGHLHTVIEVIRPDRQIRKFVYDGYICGDHLMLVGQPAIVGSEQHAVHVFPDAVKSQRESVSGLCFVDSFDGSRLVTPSILSEQPLTTQTTAGQVPAQEEAALNKHWKLQLAQTRQLNFDPASFLATVPARPSTAPDQT